MAEDLPLSGCLVPRQGGGRSASKGRRLSSPGTAPLLPSSAANTELPEIERALAKLSRI